MTATVTTGNARHLLFRLTDAARLPDALLGRLRDEVVLAGWMRASGVLHDVKIRAIGANAPRTLTGALQAITIEGSVGLSQGDVTVGLRAVLSRETDNGLETIAGEIVEARVGALEVVVTAFDEVTATRQAGPGGVWLLDPTGSQQARPAPAPPAPAPSAPAAPAAPASPEPAPIAPAAIASPPSDPELTKPSPPKPSPTFMSAAIPPRPVKPASTMPDEEQIYPDAGDVVEHFAFGRCEVVKSDGDRLHLRLGKDGRIKEIALEMLKVTPLPPVEGAAGRHFKLDRKL